MKPMDPRLPKLLGGNELAGLRQRLRRQFERSEPDMAPGLVRLGSLEAAEREALALLMGRPPREAKSIQIDIAQLDAMLREAGIAASLRHALEQLDGPIVHRASERAAALAGWSAIAASCTHPALTGYLQLPAGLGLLKRLARQDISAAQRLLEAAAAVLRRLPAGGVARAQLAAETLGNAHALDNGQATATLLLAALRQREKQQPDADDPAAALDERTREVWARVGVLVNELARPALVLNLPVALDAPAPGEPGEPAYLSLRRLLRAPPLWAVAGQTVFVCENPNLVAIAADRLGPQCAALVCTDGMPAAAQRTLLTQLAHAGAHLRYHGDFDWPGVQIGNHVLRVWGATSWRFGAADYEAAAAAAVHIRRDLADVSIAASWDAALAPAMRRRGHSIAEEAVAASLLGDLRRD